MRFLVVILLCLTSLLANDRLASSCHAQDDSGFKFLEVTVVDPDGKPLADVPVDVKIDGMEFPMPTDEDGMISLNVPSGDNSRLELRVKHEEFAAVAARWRGGKSFPEEFSIPLEQGVPIGGIVHDEKDQPIEGVKIEATISGGSQADGKLRPLLRGHLATTDEDGRWQIVTTSKPVQDLLLKLSHESYVSHTSYGSRASWQQLRRLDHVLVLEKGIELKGQVTDSQDEPIADAIVFLGGSRYISNEDIKKKTATTDDQGNYHFANVAAGSTFVTVAARGHAPDLRTVQTKKEMQPVDFQLQPGKTIRILVTDPDGEPIAGVGVAADTWRGQRSLPETLYRSKTGDDGIWQCDSMPDDVVRFDLFKRGHMSSRNHDLAPQHEAHTIVMPWPLTVSGKVVDAESGLPLETFDVVQGIDWGNNNNQVHWERYNVKQGADGKYQTEFTEPRSGHYVRIEAEGYRPAVSRMLRDDEGDVIVNFKLEEGSGPSGTVTTPDGKPAVGAQIMVATPNEAIHIYNGHAQQFENQPAAQVDEQGEYQLPYQEAGDTIVVCRHETGYAQLDGTQLEDSPDIKLTPWCTVEGTVYAGDEPLANESIQLYFQQQYVRNAPQVYWNFSTKSDATGGFKFNRLIAKEGVIARSIRFADTGEGGFMSAYSNSEQVMPIPDQTVKVQIGGVGRAIKGKLRVPDDHEREVNWSMGSVQMYEQTPSRRGSAGESFFKALGRAITGATARPATPPKPTFRRNYASVIDPEGGFAIADVVPGSYQMNIQLYPPPTNGQRSWQPLGMLQQQVTIPETDGERNQEPFDLGELTLQMTKPTPQPTATGTLQIFTSPAQ